MKIIKVIKFGLILTGVALALVPFLIRNVEVRAGSKAQAAPVIISDDTFDPGDWSVQANVTNGATYTISQAVSGGNPGPYRRMVHTLPAPSAGQSASVDVYHIYQAQTYDPQTQGAIGAIDYAHDTILRNRQVDTPFRNTQVVVEQNGRLYRTNLSDLGFANFNTSWQTASAPNLIAADFTAVDGSGDQPDFSFTGQPIRFGYYRGNSVLGFDPPPPDEVVDHGLDNWTVTIQPDQDPANEAPMAEADTAVVPIFESVTVDVLENDTDPDGDPLSVVAVSQGSDGRVSTNGTTVRYEYDGDSRFDDFRYTVSDGVLTDTALVTILVDCGCSFTCLNLKNNAVAENSFAPIRPGSPSLAPASVQEDDIDLALIYRVRDEILAKTPAGRRYIDYYYKSNPEILMRTVMNEPLRKEALATVQLWQANLRSLVEGDGTAKITPQQVEAIDNFLNNLLTGASAELQQLIAAELVRLGPLDDYAGLTMAEARSQAIGDLTTYLPLIVK